MLAFPEDHQVEFDNVLAFSFYEKMFLCDDDCKVATIQGEYDFSINSCDDGVTSN